MTIYEDLKGKVVLITGAAGGIGSVTARTFLAQGCKLALVDWADQPLAKVVADLGAPEGTVISCKADVAQEADVKAYVDATVAAFGTIDVFFNNAGVEGKVAPLHDQDMADVDRLLGINLRGVFMGLKYVLPVMYAHKSGSVINTSSQAGLSGASGGLSPYITSKFAVRGMTHVASSEAAPYNVRVNSVHPSAVNTMMMRRIEEGYAPGAGADAIADFAAGIPMGRYAEAQDIANAVVFLAADASSFITGTELRVDGGAVN